MMRGVLMAAAAGGRADQYGASEGLAGRGFALATARPEVEQAGAWHQCLAAGWDNTASWLVGMDQASPGFRRAASVDEVWEQERRSPIFAHVGDLRRYIEAQRWRGVLTLTNGVFDLLHVGHLRSLREARALGDLLVVALNSDRSAAALHRCPAQGEFARAELLAALEPVNYVVLFDEPDPRAVISELRPAVLAKGGDYAESDVVGGELLASWGGRVVVTQYEPEQSSTGLAQSASGRRQR